MLKAKSSTATHWPRGNRTNHSSSKETAMKRYARKNNGGIWPAAYLLVTKPKPPHIAMATARNMCQRFIAKDLFSREGYFMPRILVTRS